MHTLVGADAAECSMNASNMFKPMLAGGELHAIGATTLDEYRKYIEKDAAPERRFQPVYVTEPSVEDTISILRGLKERYEVHHGVRITDGAVIAAATLGHRYISDRFLPDKAIDLVDEAASRLRMEIDSKPAELDEVDREIMQREIEREALKKEKDRASRERLQKLEEELANLKEQSTQLTARWQAEKDAIQEVRDIKEQIDQVNLQIEQAERDVDLRRAAELRDSRLRQLEQDPIPAEERLNELQRDVVPHRRVNHLEIRAGVGRVSLFLRRYPVRAHRRVEGVVAILHRHLRVHLPVVPRIPHQPLAAVVVPELASYFRARNGAADGASSLVHHAIPVDQHRAAADAGQITIDIDLNDEVPSLDGG